MQHSTLLQSCRRVLYSLSFLLLLTGCAVIKEADEAKRDGGSAPGEHTATAKEVGIQPNVPLTLENAVDIALKWNPSIAISRAQISSAEASLNQIDAGLLPQISASANAQVQSGDSSGNKSQNLGISGNQLLFDFQKTDAQSHKAVEELIAAQSEFISIQAETAFNVRQAFLNVLKQQELVTVAKESIVQFEKRLEQVQAFVDVGTRVKYDLTKAQVDLAAERLNLVKANTQLAVNRAILNNALGLAENPDYSVQKPAFTEVWAQSFDEVVSEMHSKHPSLLAQKFRVQAARYAIDAAIAEFYPQLSFKASYGESGSLTPFHWSWLLGPVLNIPLFSGWSTSAKVRGAIANLHQAYATRAKAEQSLFLQARQAFSLLEDSRERMKIVVLSIKLAQENLSLVQNRFMAGKASSVEVTDAQAALTNARAEEINAQYDYQIAVSALLKSIGVVK